MRCRGALDEAGISLVESLVACALLSAGLLSLVQVCGVAAALNVSSRHTTLAAVLAAQKLEQLRGGAAQASGLDFVDAAGLSLVTGGEPPPGAVFRRRWTVDPLDARPGEWVVVQVLVTPVAHPDARWREVRLVTVGPRTTP